MSELLKEMGQRILERRKQLNMTQETLANLTHLTSVKHLVSAQTIYCVVKFLKQTLRCSSRRFPH